MKLFSLANITRIYDRRTVLDIPELEIEEGRIHALLGPNGAGKTTLLNLLGFLESPTSGAIQFQSKPVRYNETELQQLRRMAVVVDQHPILFTTTVYKNLEFGLKIRGIPPVERRHLIEETLDLVGMRSFIRYPSEYYHHHIKTDQRDKKNYGAFHHPRQISGGASGASHHFSKSGTPGPDHV
jgi:tungstate transport system ATP-binding protein